MALRRLSISYNVSPFFTAESNLLTPCANPEQNAKVIVIIFADASKIRAISEPGGPRRPVPGLFSHRHRLVASGAIHGGTGSQHRSTRPKRDREPGA